MQIHVRYDEISLKGGNRSFFERRLKKNLGRLIGDGARVKRTHGRMIVTVEDSPGALDAVKRCFGVASASPVQIVAKDEAAIAAAAIDVAREAVDRGLHTFKVEARRQDKSFPVKSNELAPRIGGEVLKALSARGLTVDVHHPAFTVGVEVAREGAAIHALSVDGPGGMPVGTAGKALCLLSGGIDSPVAAWFSMKRGLRTDHVYFHSFPFTGDKAKEKTLTLAQTLSRWAPDPVFVHVVSLTKVQEAIGKTGEDALRVILLRRFMYRIASGLARRFGHKVLVTGEALGQVASQTVENLRCVEAVVPDMLVLRPLIGFDKKEIVARAREIATFETSILPHEDCCSLFAPRRPATRGTPEECAALEAQLDVAGLEAEALATFEAYRIVRGSEPTLVPHSSPDEEPEDEQEHEREHEAGEDEPGALDI